MDSGGAGVFSAMLISYPHFDGYVHPGELMQHPLALRA